MPYNDAGCQTCLPPQNDVACQTYLPPSEGQVDYDAKFKSLMDHGVQAMEGFEDDIMLLVLEELQICSRAVSGLCKQRFVNMYHQMLSEHLGGSAARKAPGALSETNADSYSGDFPQWAMRRQSERSGRIPTRDAAASHTTSALSESDINEDCGTSAASSANPRGNFLQQGAHAQSECSGNPSRDAGDGPPTAYVLSESDIDDGASAASNVDPHNIDLPQRGLHRQPGRSRRIPMRAEPAPPTSSVLSESDIDRECGGSSASNANLRSSEFSQRSTDKQSMRDRKLSMRAAAAPDTTTSSSQQPASSSQRPAGNNLQPAANRQQRSSVLSDSDMDGECGASSSAAPYGHEVGASSVQRPESPQQVGSPGSSIRRKSSSKIQSPEGIRRSSMDATAFQKAFASNDADEGCGVGSLERPLVDESRKQEGEPNFSQLDAQRQPEFSHGSQKLPMHSTTAPQKAFVLSDTDDEGGAGSLQRMLVDDSPWHDCEPKTAELQSPEVEEQRQDPNVISKDHEEQASKRRGEAWKQDPNLISRDHEEQASKRRGGNVEKDRNRSGDMERSYQTIHSDDSAPGERSQASSSNDSALPERSQASQSHSNVIEKINEVPNAPKSFASPIAVAKDSRKTFASPSPSSNNTTSFSKARSRYREHRQQRKTISSTQDNFLATTWHNAMLKGGADDNTSGDTNEVSKEGDNRASPEMKGNTNEVPKEGQIVGAPKPQEAACESEASRSRTRSLVPMLPLSRLSQFNEGGRSHAFSLSKPTDEDDFDLETMAANLMRFHGEMVEAKMAKSGLWPGGSKGARAKKEHHELSTDTSDASSEIFVNH